MITLNLKWLVIIDTRFTVPGCWKPEEAVERNTFGAGLAGGWRAFVVFIAARLVVDNFVAFCTDIIVGQVAEKQQNYFLNLFLELENVYEKSQFKK